MKKLLLWAWLLAAFSGWAQSPVIITYVGGYRGNLVDTRRIEAKYLTHLLYAFANVRHNRAVLDYPRTDVINMRNLVRLKQVNPGLKVMLSVGGLGWSRNFSDMALTANGRETFARSCLNLIKRFNLDGIDIDWEFPGYPGEGGNIFRAEDKQNYTLLFKTLRATLGKQYLITTAVDGWVTHFVPHTEMDQVALYADYICLMTYNFNENGMAGGHYLFSPPGWNPAGSVDGAVKGFLAAGVPKTKLIIGAGFFPATLQMQSSNPHDRYYLKKLPFKGGLTRVNQLLAGNKGYRAYWDSSGKAPYLFNPQTRVRIAYEDTASVGAKAKYIKDEGLAGFMYWDYFSDPGRHLLHHLYKQLNNSP